MKSLSYDRWSKKNLPNEKQVLQFFPVSAESTYLWLQFIGKSIWQTGSWVYHSQTAYLDVEMVDEGEMFVTYGGERVHVPAGSAILIPPGESKLSAGSKMRCRKRFLGITGPVLANNMNAMNLNRVTLLRNFQNSEFEEIFAALFTLWTAKKNDSVLECCALIYKLLLLLSQSAGEQHLPPELQRAVNFINSNFSCPMDLEVICRAAECGKTKLQWLFKHHLESTPIRYLTQVRMTYAEKLLRNTNFSIKETADRSGYGDPLYFSSTFLKHYGSSPREYRKNKGPVSTGPRKE